MTPRIVPEHLHHIVEAASLAPSVHNTQPWRFVTSGDRLELHADPQRQLRVLDPDGRQLHLSCGAALLHAVVAARALGLNAVVQLLPIPTDTGHLADVLLSPGPGATPDELRRAAAILERHTHRGAFDPRPLPAAVLDLLVLAAAAHGGRLDVITREDQLIDLEVMLARADDLEEHDAKYQRELQDWVHADPGAFDGIPVAAIETAPGSTLRQRDFGVTTGSGLSTAPSAENPTVAVLISDDDNPESWLRAGQALAAVLLQGADHGVQAQPLGQVTDVVAYRLGLRRALGILGMPQLVLRMGYAAGTARTPRRPVGEVLTRVAD